MVKDKISMVVKAANNFLNDDRAPNVALLLWFIYLLWVLR